MRIVHANIFGFGKWVDYSIDFTTGGMTGIYGENESGKSTIQKFILFMLFGLPPKQREAFRPKTSGKMGGRLTVHDAEAGLFTIERLDEVRNGQAVCYTPDGGEFDESWLKTFLKGMTYHTYQSIFSFSAADLNEIKNMKEDDLGEVLFSIGLTGATNIRSIEKKLETKAGELFKPYGKKPVINQRLSSLNHQFISLEQLRKEESAYSDNKKEAEDLTKEIGSLEEKIQTSESSLSMIQKRVQALPIIEVYHEKKARLNQLPATVPFPENGLSRMEKIKDQLLPMQSELAVLQDNEANNQQTMKNIKEKKADDALYKQAKTFLERKAAYQEAKKEMEEAREQSTKLMLQMENECKRLNIGLVPADFETLSFPFHIEQTWNQLKKDADRLQLEKDQLNTAYNQLKQERNYTLNKMQELEEDELSEERAAELREKLHEQKAYDLLQQQNTMAQENQEKWEKAKAKKAKKRTSLFITALGSAFVIGIIAIVSPYTWLLFLSIILILLGFVLHRWNDRTIMEMEEMLKTQSQQSMHDITDQEKEEAERLLSLHEKNTKELHVVHEQQRTVDVKFIEWREKEKSLDERKKQLQNKLDDQYEKYPFLQNVELTYWPEVYHPIKELLKIWNQKMDGDQNIRQLEDQTNVFEKEVQAFAANINWEERSPLYVIEQLCQTYEKADQEIIYYEEMSQKNKHTQQEIKQKMKPYEEEKQSLLNTANADTEEAYYKQAKTFQEKVELEAAIANLKQQFAQIFPDSSWGEFSNNTTDQQTLKEQKERAQAEITKLKEQMDTAREQLANVNVKLSQLEESERYSDAMHQFEMAAEDVNQLAKEWAVIKTAKEMLRETKRGYRDKYLSKVIDETSDVFQELTGGRYQKVYPPVDGKPFQVEAYDYIRYSVNELSQGTVDQLYISLRLGISSIMSQEHHLPFIIDDAFVHFDDNRIMRMMKIMERMAEKQQVIIFTCKKEVADCFSNTGFIRLMERKKTEMI